MSKDDYTYTVKCRTCKRPFQIQLFESHEKNLFLVDKKDWFCEECKQDYFKTQTEKLVQSQKNVGFGELTGTPKMVSWAVKIREDILKKVDYLEKSLKFNDKEQKSQSDQAFELLFKQWQKETEAKWWIDHRKMTVRDIANKIEENMKEIG